MDIDRKRIAAVRALEALEYAYNGGEWFAPASAASACSVATTPLSLLAKADAMHGALMRRADALAGCTEGSDGEAEIRATVDAIEAYQIKRWPLGKEPGGVGAVSLGLIPGVCQIPRNQLRGVCGTPRLCHQVRRELASSSRCGAYPAARRQSRYQLRPLLSLFQGGFVPKACGVIGLIPCSQHHFV
jgi:hypothetical protein